MAKYVERDGKIYEQGTGFLWSDREIGPVVENFWTGDRTVERSHAFGPDERYTLSRPDPYTNACTIRDDKGGSGTMSPPHPFESSADRVGSISYPSHSDSSSPKTQTSSYPSGDYDYSGSSASSHSGTSGGAKTFWFALGLAVDVILVLWFCTNVLKESFSFTKTIFYIAVILTLSVILMRACPEE